MAYRDPVIPNVTAKNDSEININIPTSDATLVNQGDTYNQSSVTFNQAGIKYAGIQDVSEDQIPMLFTSGDEMPSLNIVLDSINISNYPTQAILVDQGYTYNQAGLSFNQAAIEYGGIGAFDQDVLPLELSFTDIYTKFVPPPPAGSNIPLGPGWFLFVPQ